LVSILKLVNPMTVSTYGPLLDAWAPRAWDRYQLAQILKLANPITASAYGPMLDAWARAR
jgi:hypothetical protein